MDKPLRVMVVDDNALLCTGLERWLAEMPGVAAVRCLNDWRLAEAAVKDFGPDVLLLDIDMPGVSGLDLIRPLSAACPACNIVMLSGLVTRDLVERAIDLGAAGYFVKDQDARHMADLIRIASEGGLALCPAAAAALAGP